jgi:hypothetical protein
MASLLLAILTAWCLFQGLRGRAGLPELAVFVVVISWFSIYFRFDQVWAVLWPLVLFALFVLIAIMIRLIVRGDEGRIFGYAGLAGAGLLFYFGILGNFVQVWRGQVTDLDTPVWNGGYYVVHGGNTLLVNGHRISAAATAQRYAVDIVRLSQTGQSARKLWPGDDLSQYVVYGEGVHAPCAGTVLLVDKRFDDLPAGTSDPDHPAGNYIAIGCDQGVTVVLAHLQREIHPSLGDRIVDGQYRGKVGNTGNTTEPHLHIHAVAGLVRDEREALFTGEGIPFTLNHTVLFRNMRLVVIGCPPISGIDLWSAVHPRETKLSITRFSPALSKSMVSLLPSTALITP